LRPDEIILKCRHQPARECAGKNLDPWRPQALIDIGEMITGAIQTQRNIHQRLTGSSHNHNLVQI
jgi:hypothetical protein